MASGPLLCINDDKALAGSGSVHGYVFKQVVKFTLV